MSRVTKRTGVIPGTLLNIATLDSWFAVPATPDGIRVPP